MRKLLVAGTIAGALFASSAASRAETFQYSYRVDTPSLDPYAISETFALAFQGLIYEPLIGRGRNLELVPALAVEWKNTTPDIWRFKLRPNVRFTDGSPFSADDVLFSFNRVQMEGSDVGQMVNSVKEMKKVDDLTLDMVTKQPNPILPQQLSSWFIMSKAWSEKHGAEAPASIKSGKKNHATITANGTGPFMIKSRQQDVKTVFVPNPHWWGKVEHNLTEAVFTPIKSDATRVAALLSGEVDMIYPVALQDVERVSAAPNLTALQGAELRTIFLNMDQSRDELLESNIKGRNPFKDLRVRQAVYQAIDIEAIRAKVMRGASVPAGLMVAPGIVGFDPALNARPAFDPEAAKKLLAEAGYPSGFEVGMDCPNDRYVNDEKICIAIVGMLARIGIKVNLLAQTRTKYFEKILSRNTSFCLLAWAPLTYDSHSPLNTVMSTPDGKRVGSYNVGGYSNARVDELTRLIETETDQAKRQTLISEAFRLHKIEIGHIPLHQQALAWGVRKNIDLVQRADDSLDLRWVVVKKK